MLSFCQSQGKKVRDDAFTCVPTKCSLQFLTGIRCLRVHPFGTRRVRILIIKTRDDFARKGSLTGETAREMKRSFYAKLFLIKTSKQSKIGSNSREEAAFAVE